MAESVQETVRLPESLVDYIDKRFVESGLFSSRADFVYSAIRYYYEDSIHLFSRYAEVAYSIRKEDPYAAKLYPTTLALVKGMMQNTRRMHRVDNYNGKKIPILLRLPPQFVKQYTRFINESCIYKNKADFFNKSLEFYLDAQFYVQSIHTAIHQRDGNGITHYRDDMAMNDVESIIQESVIGDEWEPVNIRDAAKEDWLDDIKLSSAFLSSFEPGEVKALSENAHK